MIEALKWRVAALERWSPRAPILAARVLVEHLRLRIARAVDALAPSQPAFCAGARQMLAGAEALTGGLLAAEAPGLAAWRERRTAVSPEDLGGRFALCVRATGLRWLRNACDALARLPAAVEGEHDLARVLLDTSPNAPAPPGSSAAARAAAEATGWALAALRHGSRKVGKTDLGPAAVQLPRGRGLAGWVDELLRRTLLPWALGGEPGPVPLCVDDPEARLVARLAREWDELPTPARVELLRCLQLSERAAFTRAEGSLRAALGADDPRVRRVAARLLEPWLAAATSETFAAARALALDSAQPESTRAPLLQGLVRERDAQVTRALPGLLRDEGARRAALDALSRFLPEREVELLRGALEGEPDAHRRRELAERLARRADDQTQRALRLEAADPGQPASARRAAIRELRGDDPEVLQLLVRLSQDEDESIRRTAFGELHLLPRAMAAPLVLAALERERSDATRRVLLGWLERFGKESELAPLEAFAARERTSVEVGLFAQRVLSAIRERAAAEG